MKKHALYNQLETVRELLAAEVEYDGQLQAVSKVLQEDFEQIFLVGSMFNRHVVCKSQQCVAVFHAQKGSNIDFFRDKYSAELAPTASENAEIHHFQILDEASFLKKITSPVVQLIVLYHQENFPLPRFALGISDIATSLRDNMLGTVVLTDMQLGETIDSLEENIRKNKPDIVGISVTFGQQDLLEVLIERIQTIPDYDPLIVTGGSLSALNATLLLRKFPRLIVGLGYGETTMKHLVEFWHGKRAISQINHIAFAENGEVITTPKVVDDKQTYLLPELDLLSKTLRMRGVLQLESSRGCTYACSFCPRGHKGRWSGNIGREIYELLPVLDDIYKKFPEISRKIFLVDEEFIGYADSMGQRALEIAKQISASGFKFESSTRIDQVYRPRQAKEWHISRILFWKGLKKNGLSRMLFGVESGVDSILHRFNKKTTARQNLVALRMLSMLNIPIRVSYITFDPLMTMQELIESFEFQGRTDILLNTSAASEEELFDIAISDKRSIRESSGKPLYTSISYMLVSMESLTNSMYLKMVHEAGLTLDEDLSMGRVRTRYENPRIGLMSELSQLWVDRNFALDYLLKSLMKISDEKVCGVLIRMREMLKESAYLLLGKMLSIVENDLRFVKSYLSEKELEALRVLNNSINYEASLLHLKEVLENVMEDHFVDLKNAIVANYEVIQSTIPVESREILKEQLNTWKNAEAWELINGKKEEENEID